MHPGDLVQGGGGGGAAAAPKKHVDVKIPMQQKLVVGAIAGVIGTCCIFPIDVAKTRLQNQKPGPARYSPKQQNCGVTHFSRRSILWAQIM